MTISSHFAFNILQFRGKVVSIGRLNEPIKPFEMKHYIIGTLAALVWLATGCGPESKEQVAGSAEEQSKNTTDSQKQNIGEEEESLAFISDPITFNGYPRGPKAINRSADIKALNRTLLLDWTPLTGIRRRNEVNVSLKFDATNDSLFFQVINMNGVFRYAETNLSESDVELVCYQEGQQIMLRVYEISGSGTYDVARMDISSGASIDGKIGGTNTHNPFFIGIDDIRGGEPIARNRGLSVDMGSNSEWQRVRISFDRARLQVLIMTDQEFGTRAVGVRNWCYPPLVPKWGGRLEDRTKCAN